MAQGAEVIYQACLHAGEFTGYADFLRRADGHSALGDYGYEVVDTKLARSAKAKFIIQLCLYSDLLADAQGLLPQRMHVVLGDGTEESFRVANYFRYYRAVKARFLERLGGVLPETYPEACAHCALCHWRDLCRARWEQDDHLNQVANITKVQIEKLNAGGVRTLAALARLPAGQRVAAMQAETLERLRGQASLQLCKRETGSDRYELRKTDPAEIRGFRRLPRPDPGDLFFDMEGDPFEDGGLEYLFGVVYLEDGSPRFQPFWAHTRQEERQGFERFMAFVTERLDRYPKLHIYHYASYEPSALKRLMSLHGTCEAEVDRLLRAEKLVDLYKVVREALLVSEPRYSIKNLEAFYMGKRTGEVTHAGASIVYYDRWRETEDPSLLEQIRAYNEDDCRSTYLLRNWLLEIRPQGTVWFSGTPQADGGDDKSERVHEAEARLAEYEARLLGALPPDREEWGQEDHLRELVFQLLDFHRRAAKPQWWAMFARREMAEEDLVDDPECIGALQATPERPPQTVKRSVVYTFRYPPQEFKLDVGDDCLRADTLERAGLIEAIDEDGRLVQIKLGMRFGVLPERLSVIPTGPIDTGVLKEALYRFADSVIAGDRRYAALEAILRRERPAIRGLPAGSPVIGTEGDAGVQVIDAVSRLQESYLFIQGPPGAGKTYTGSRVIVALLQRGARVGVSSNSHKAINNLLAAVERCAAEENVRFRGVKKSTSEETFLNGQIIEDVADNGAVVTSGAALVAGTAWLFADPELDRALDYLFVDEAGQVALANLIAMGTCAKNIVLLGDQMQLQQPIQGVHPGHSGESALDYLLEGQATIPMDHGVFLGTTWRMHDDVCRFISEAVYDGRLHPHPDNWNQRLLLKPSAHAESGPRAFGSSRWITRAARSGASRRRGSSWSCIRACSNSVTATGTGPSTACRRRTSSWSPPTTCRSTC